MKVRRSYALILHDFGLRFISYLHESIFFQDRFPEFQHDIESQVEEELVPLLYKGNEPDLFLV